MYNANMITQVYHVKFTRKLLPGVKFAGLIKLVGEDHGIVKFTSKPP